MSDTDIQESRKGLDTIRTGVRPTKAFIGKESSNKAELLHETAPRVTKEKYA